MSKRRANPAILHAVAVSLKKVMRERGMTPSKAAEELGIRRQTLWLYLNEKSMPGGAVLGRACDLWNLSLNVDGFTFTKEAFARQTKTRPRTKQLDLFDLVDRIRPDQIKTRLIGGTDVFELRVRIKAAS